MPRKHINASERDIKTWSKSDIFYLLTKLRGTGKALELMENAGWPMQKVGRNSYTCNPGWKAKLKSPV